MQFFHREGGNLGGAHLVYALACLTQVLGIAGTITYMGEEIEAAFQQLDLARAQFETGICPLSVLHSAEAGLITAKLQRARSSKNQPEVLTLLEQLVQVRNKELESVQAMFRASEASQSDVQATMKSLIEAQAELQAASAEER